jgi:hypothetical protein
MSVRDRPRSGSTEKTAVGFCADKIQTKASLGSPRPTFPHRPTHRPRHRHHYSTAIWMWSLAPRALLHTI